MELPSGVSLFPSALHKNPTVKLKHSNLFAFLLSLLHSSQLIAHVRLSHSCFSDLESGLALNHPGVSGTMLHSPDHLSSYLFCSQTAAPGLSPLLRHESCFILCTPVRNNSLITQMCWKFAPLMWKFSWPHILHCNSGPNPGRAPCVHLGPGRKKAGSSRIHREDINWAMDHFHSLV